MRIHAQVQQRQEAGHGQFHQHQGQGAGDEGQQHRFRQELHHQHAAPPAQSLADGHLPRAQGGAGGGQVDEVDDGDPQHQRPHAQEGNQQAEGHAVVADALDMHPGQRLQVQGHAGLARGRVQVLRHAGCQEAGEARHQGRRLHPRLQQQVGTQEAVVPLGVSRGERLIPAVVETGGDVGQHFHMEDGVGRQVADDARHRQRHARGQGNGAAQDVDAGKQLARRRLRQDHGAGLADGGGGIARQEGPVEQAEIVGVGQGQVHLEHGAVAAHRHGMVHHPHHGLRLREVARQGRPHGLGLRRHRHGGAAGRVEGADQALDAVGVGEEAVIVHLMPDEEADHGRRGHAQRQAGDVQGGVEALAHQDPHGDLQKIAEHDAPLPLRPLRRRRAIRPLTILAPPCAYS
ncbi:hypothetical protein AZA_45676 [Nitrospirillum viridazoti Y2]|nr:hypothetical protein AZA_45676 [Nitrospirillum amazonense Y2]